MPILLFSFEKCLYRIKHNPHISHICYISLYISRLYGKVSRIYLAFTSQQG